MATWTVGLEEVRATIGQKKSFQEAMKVSIPSTAIAGRAIGRTIDRKIRSDDAPSTRPASTSSSGSALTRYRRMKNTPNALTRLGKVKAFRGLPQFSFTISRKSGMVPTWEGTLL